jgi:hypothetical protein
VIAMRFRCFVCTFNAESTARVNQCCHGRDDYRHRTSRWGEHGGGGRAELPERRHAERTDHHWARHRARERDSARPGGQRLRPAGVFCLRDSTRLQSGLDAEQRQVVGLPPRLRPAAEPESRCDDHRMRPRFNGTVVVEWMNVSFGESAPVRAGRISQA